MPIACKEMPTGRSLSGKQGSQQFIIRGAASDDEALGALYAIAPTSFGGLPRQDTDCQVEEAANVMGTLIYTGTAKYGVATFDPLTQQVGDFSFSFDIGSTTENLKQSYSTRHKYTAPGAKARDFKGAIGVDGDGNIAGVDVTAPVLTYTVTKTFSAGAVTLAYVDTLAGIVGTVNNAPGLGIYQTGELLLTGVTGTQVNGEKWNLTFKFAVKKNRTNITIDTITGIEKYGWEYLWGFYEETTETIDGVKFTRRKATNAYVEQVYPLTNYAALGI